MDRKVNSADASMVLQAVSGKKVLSEEQKERADVDGDAKITQEDVQLILQYDVGAVDRFQINVKNLVAVCAKLHVKYKKRSCIKKWL